MIVMVDIETIYFAVVLGPIAILVLLLIVVNVCKTLSPAPWHAALGEIEESSIQYEFDGGRFLAVRYKFVVKDQQYWGGQNLSIQSEANEDLAKIYAAGNKVSVLFHPEDPEHQSMLKPLAKRNSCN